MFILYAALQETVTGLRGENKVMETEKVWEHGTSCPQEVAGSRFSPPGTGTLWRAFTSGLGVLS